MVFWSFLVLFLECIYLILLWQSKALPSPKFVVKAVQTSTRYHMFRQVVPIMNCSLATDASFQLKPASSHEHFLLWPLVLLGGKVKKLWGSSLSIPFIVLNTWIISPRCLLKSKDGSFRNLSQSSYGRWLMLRISLVALLCTFSTSNLSLLYLGCHSLWLLL